MTDIERLKALYFELETVDFDEDNRHSKFDVWEELELFDDCDEDTNIIDTTRNLTINTNNLKMLTEN